MVWTCNRKALDVRVLCQHIATISWHEHEMGFTINHIHLTELRSCTRLLLAIGPVERKQSQSATNLLLVLRMDVICHTDVDVHSHSNSIEP